MAPYRIALRNEELGPLSKGRPLFSPEKELRPGACTPYSVPCCRSTTATPACQKTWPRTEIPKRKYALLYLLGKSDFRKYSPTMKEGLYLPFSYFSVSTETGLASTAAVLFLPLLIQPQRNQ